MVPALTDAEAIRLYPELADLITLRDSGWSFLPVNTAEGQPVELDGFKAWPGGWVDGLRIYSGTSVMGIRTTPDEPPAIVWERTGSLSQIVAELLTLSVPGSRLAPHLVVASAPTLWTP